ncbi:hypothetical protein CRG98_010730 [Punica granatum]|uniref:Uncharacterized protein n=1 Tax=Punica granatum TaxID=22663 RepID=A0A2I0KK26_PUNGR|nr:hypothetical protein CRG98_010730 [Punica granatum]
MGKSLFVPPATHGVPRADDICFRESGHHHSGVVCAAVLGKARRAGSHEDRRVEQMSLKAVNARCQNLKAVNAGLIGKCKKCESKDAHREQPSLLHGPAVTAQSNNGPAQSINGGRLAFSPTQPRPEAQRSIQPNPAHSAQLGPATQRPNSPTKFSNFLFFTEPPLNFPN